MMSSLALSSAGRRRVAPAHVSENAASVGFRQPQDALGDVRQDQLPADRGDAGDLDLAKKPLDVEFAGIAHAAMGQDRGLASAVPGLGGKIFGGVGEGTDLAGLLAAVIGGSGAQYQQLGGLQLDPALGERVLNALVLTDGTAEDDPLAGVAGGAGE